MIAMSPIVTDAAIWTEVRKPCWSGVSGRALVSDGWWDEIASAM